MVGGSRVMAEGLNPLTISHTPMNTSHRPPGMAWTEFSWNPRICRTDPSRMTAYPTRPHTARGRGIRSVRKNAEHRIRPATPTVVMANSYAYRFAWVSTALRAWR